MKNLLSAFFFLYCAVSTGLAQPVLTNTNCAPDTATTWHRRSCSTYPLPGAAGSDVTWDFSNLNYGSETDIVYGNVSGSTQASQFPEANLVSYDNQQQEYFFNVNDDSLVTWGAYSPNGTFAYSDPFLQLTFPFTFGSTVSDTYAGTGTIPGDNVTRTGTAVIEADAYGTLLLPGNVTITDVLRVTTTWTDHQVNASGTSTTMDAVTYRWYRPGTRDCLLEYMRYTYTGVVYMGYAWLHDFEAVAETQEAAAWEPGVAPNPATAAATIDLSGAQGPVSVCLIAADGTLTPVAEDFEGSVLQLDGSHLAPGVYFYRVTDANRTFTGRIVFM